ncbi:hypothetical protein HQR76_004311 [Salmonella enterica]|nr:hypothetical protein [Salmonella enterica]
MKKTLIALVVAASAAVSGSAMAWTDNGIGGTFELRGTLTPVDKATPWQVQVAPGVNDLDSSISKGSTKVTIHPGNNIPVLAIRDKAVFHGQTGIVPTINYNGAIDTSKFTNNTTELTLDVHGENGNKIGVLTAPLFAAAMEKLVWGGSNVETHNLYASKDGAFNGGIPTASGGVNTSGTHDIMEKFFSDIWANEIPKATTSWHVRDNESFADAAVEYSASYASGIRSASDIIIQLDAPAANDVIKWSAQLPVTVSYQ